jgi:predicted AAA+ superfamily ATPase
MNKAAAAKVGSSLVARKLMREMSIWREENGRTVSLVITRAGGDAIGVENDTAKSDRSAKKTSVAAASERGSD